MTAVNALFALGYRSSCGLSEIAATLVLDVGELSP